MRSRAAVPRPLVVVLVLVHLLLLQATSLGTGGLPAAVALAVTATVAAGLAASVLLAARGVPGLLPARVREAIRDRARRTAFLPQRDPDAPGRRRPRAPGTAVPATAA